MRFYLIIFLSVLSFSSKLSGQNFEELQKLQAEYKKALERQSLQKPDDIVKAEKNATSTALPDKLIYSRKDIETP